MTTGEIDRRGLFKGVGAALVIGFALPVRGAAALAAAEPFAPNAFIRISPTGITIVSKHLEMGQGIETGLAMVVAEELDANWTRIKVAAAPVNPQHYANPVMHDQGTGGSNSMMGSYAELRDAGAAARAMIVQAAALQWDVPAAEIGIERGVVRHVASGKKARLETFAQAAGAIPAPSKPVPKAASDFRLVGQNVHRLDTPGKIRGATIFTADFDLPNMVRAVVRRPPRFGARVGSFDAAAALATPGVLQVVQIPTGIAVVARTHWAALQGRESLQIAWDDRDAEQRGSEELDVAFRALAQRPGSVARAQGDIASALAAAPTTITAEYGAPYLAHAMMEPLNCVVRREDRSCELWYGCQFPGGDRRHVAAALNLPPDRVTIHTLPAGGSFGRRGSFTADFVVEAVEIAKALPPGIPVSVQWTREDDITGGCYRPMSRHRLDAAVDADGRLRGWRHRIVVQSIAETIPIPGLVKNGIDPISIRNAIDPPYDLPDMALELHSPKVGVTVMPWRSVGSSYNVFAMECFVDLIARRTKQDPLALRRLMLPAKSRFHALLAVVAERSGWHRPRPADRALGLAISTWAGSYVAHVAEVRRIGEGYRVERFTTAVDCGRVINPNLVSAQIEGGIMFGLSAALSGEITLDKGVPEQSNFDSYKVLRITDVPLVDLHLTPSEEPPSGVGEIAVSAVAPAVANALAALLGLPVNDLPLKGFLT
ncbi:xanthine dehydrogenase family protein molybdopterin-binding subunit [Sphingomonas montanisoli]|uniref:Xanthine dehydrogenase family protein molybdopterin-binding subunit n=1 Tax=Sphingomonas montanisoli TaxID=2606412 RepID=A0A5D9CDM5_9SPHN|nr:molybdopterin cofactor-binding domain-containing protein [Sphingomonas montanisoli]TZG29456.1 xanthine dehydrogenase family protein molybdopterin-binding subunit [Sphingomonas montanisoli]